MFHSQTRVAMPGPPPRSLSGIPPEIIKEMLKQQEEMKLRQRGFVLNVFLLCLAYLFLQ